ncbi:methylmalonyl-CoA mutase family protein [Nocardioides caldifontis]|uniref:methylmalonyl-CoA mutase family protein n=1 Tax=Nocardioides caldifontis TaxID=2588938 RepID=UPI0011DF94C7|nr:methylmalonyl-CoA mutase family protein [Nocardioides caldifontis]
MEHLSLLADGREHEHGRERARWEKAAADVLRKAGRMKAEDPDSLVWEKLTRTTLDGIEIAPLGTVESLDGLPDAGLPGAAPYTRGSAVSRTEQGWDVRAHLADPDAAQAAAAALDDLENGVTSLWLTVGRGGVAAGDLPTVLEKVYVDLAPVVLDSPDDPVAAAEAFCAVLADRDVTPAPGTSLGGDPVGAEVRGHIGRDPQEVVTRLVELAREHGTLALTVDATAVHDAGATDAQELGYSLALGAAYLRMLTDRAGPGLDVATAAALVEFRYAATDEQFTTIAKFRAARRAWHRVLELSGAPDAPGQLQHAVTSRPMYTKYDPWVNMLRGTVAAFAAGVGGASAVTVLPFDHAIGLPDGFSRRNARNTSLLLIAESHVARVTDPGGGSYALEKLTDDLARAGWDQFQRIEAEGGAHASVRSDTGLLTRIRTQAVEPRQRQIAKRRRPITGVSEFPNLEETLPERRPHPEGAAVVTRYAEPYEVLRDEPAATPVFLATMGPVAHHTARAGFAANLLAAGGVDTVQAGATNSVEEVVSAYRSSEPMSPVVCLAGTDQAYAEWGSELAAELREAGASYVVLAGKPGDRTVPVGKVDDSCAMGVDALAFLGRVRKELAK